MIRRMVHFLTPQNIPLMRVMQPWVFASSYSTGEIMAILSQIPTLVNVMNFDPRVTSDGNGYEAAYGVDYNFQFGYVHESRIVCACLHDVLELWLYHVPDVFDEDAKIEEACVQALHHLIAKAYAEIDELEQLAILQDQWAQSDELEVCCAVFQQRIQRLYDNIDTLIRNNFVELEQSEEEDFCNENIDTHEGEQANTLELNEESQKQTPILEKLEKPTHNGSEESSTDAPRYTSKELTEVRSVGSSNIEVSEKVEIAGGTSEVIGGLLTSTETITSQSPLQASHDEGNSKVAAPQHGHTENCRGDLKADAGSSSNLNAKTEEIVKVVRDGHDTSIPNMSDVSVQNHEGKDSVEEVSTQHVCNGTGGCSTSLETIIFGSPVQVIDVTSKEDKLCRSLEILTDYLTIKDFCVLEAVSKNMMTTVRRKVWIWKTILIENFGFPCATHVDMEIVHDIIDWRGLGIEALSIDQIGGFKVKSTSLDFTFSTASEKLENVLPGIYFIRPIIENCPTCPTMRKFRHSCSHDKLCSGKAFGLELFNCDYLKSAEGPWSVERVGKGRDYGIARAHIQDGGGSVWKKTSCQGFKNDEACLANRSKVTIGHNGCDLHVVSRAIGIMGWELSVIKVGPNVVGAKVRFWVQDGHTDIRRNKKGGWELEVKKK